MDASSPTARVRGRRAESWRPLVVILIAAVLEILLVMPFVDDLADRSPMFHFTQHGLIFVGGVVMGFALRDLYLRSTR